jgi:hypothetical protein
MGHEPSFVLACDSNDSKSVGSEGLNLENPRKAIPSHFLCLERERERERGKEEKRNFLGFWSQGRAKLPMGKRYISTLTLQFRVDLCAGNFSCKCVHVHLG